MLKQYLCVILLLALLNFEFVLSTDSKPYVADPNQNITAKANETAPGSNSSQEASRTIVTEAGSIKLTNISTHHGRENAEINSSISSTQKPNTQVASGNYSTGNSSHTSSNHTVLTSVPLTAATVNKTINATGIPVEYNGDSKIKPRKGVNFTSSTEEPNNTVSSSTLQPLKSSAVPLSTTTTTPSTTTLKPKKPTVTIGSDDEASLIRLPPKVILNNKVLDPKNTSDNLPKLVSTGGEQILSTNHKKHPDYVLPIVLTILAVPLLAIILTVVYKRGAEWWQHRHYRRMDFLIDGIYNN